MPHGPKKDESTKVTLWYDHISKKVVVETQFFAVELERLSEVKEMALQLLEEANRLEDCVSKPINGTRKLRKIAKNYAEKAVAEWEQELSVLAKAPKKAKTLKKKLSQP